MRRGRLMTNSLRLRAPFCFGLVVMLAGARAIAAPAAPAPPPRGAGPPPTFAPVPPGFPAYPQVPAPLPGSPSPFPASAVPASGDESDDPTAPDPLTRIRDLELRLEQTREELQRNRPRVTVGGYVDFGFFVPQGDGSGIVRDSGNLIFPEYAGRYGWVFLGDLLAPTVNSRGEVADVGDAAGSVRFDSINSRGAPGFIANELNLTLTSALAESVLGTASVNFVPRTGSDFALGDFIDIDLAQIEWVLTDSGNTSLFVGKTESLLGVEYRDRKSPSRFGITPSLLARYTTAPALGIKLRTKLGPQDFLVLAGAVTNGSNTTEQFHFFDEIDSNAAKTGSGRIGVRLPFPFELELGFSGALGAQDRARGSDGNMWFWGPDLLAALGPVELKGQFLKGRSPGRPGDQVYGLRLDGGGYLEGDWMITPWLGVMARGEYRDAFVWLGDADVADGANRAYLTRSWRATGAARVVFNDRIVLKAEYLRNGEYGGIPAIKNDVFTSSLVFSN
jgi:hypothetical protein